MRERRLHNGVLALAGAGALAAAGASGIAATAQAPLDPAPAVAVAEAPNRAQRGGVIWAGDAEAPFSREWASGTAYDVNGGDATSTLEDDWASTTRVKRVSSPVAQGGSAYAVTVRAGDRDHYSSSSQRTEIGQSNPREFSDGVVRQMKQGQKRWIALQIRVPAGFPEPDWTVLSQLKGDGDGNGPFSVNWEDGRVLLQKSQSQRYGSTDISPVWTPAARSPHDRWLKLLLHVRWSTGPDGYYELFGAVGDGKGFRRLTPRRDGWTLKRDSDGGPVNVGARVGIYRSRIAQDATAYFDGVNVARTRAAATRRAFGKKR